MGSENIFRLDSYRELHYTVLYFKLILPCKYFFYVQLGSESPFLEALYLI